MVMKKIDNLKFVFEPKSIAVVGASREPNKIGHVILKNFIDGGFPGKIYPVNPSAKSILGLTCYPSVRDISGKVDSAIIAVPAKLVPAEIRECGEKGIRGVVVIAGGFAEIGNNALEQELIREANKYGMALIGPNCMGVLNPSSRVDSVFLPIYKLGRPHVGGISFISQSGAVGGCIIDLAARAGLGMAKFVSYGNASVIDETDLLSYLGKDEETKIIVLYLEGLKDGKGFMDAAMEITKDKPIIALKAGVSKKGAEAAMSHTGAMAGSADSYRAAFKQCKIIEADELEELFDFAKIFVQPKCSGDRVAVITNGGGNGVLAVDSIEKEGLKLASFSKETNDALKDIVPQYTTVRNPLDLVGDADSSRYERALNIVMRDPNVDAVVVIVLFQTVAIDSGVVNVIVRASDERKKPIVTVSTGGEYTEMHRRILDSYDVPTYPSPSRAVKALKKFVAYSSYYGEHHALGQR
jgi:acetyl coenzyme A synthetase (ADP forming)-like protein